MERVVTPCFFARFGQCPHCNMDITLLATPAGPQVTGRLMSERRGPRVTSSNSNEM
jgi:hypothetical protein